MNNTNRSEYMRSYMRAWREANKEKTKAANEKYRQANLEKTKEASKKSRSKNPEKVYATNKAYREKNSEKISIKRREWVDANIGKMNALGKKRQLAKLQRTPKWLTPDDYWMIEQAYEIASKRTKLFGFHWHVDHIIPLQGKTVSGLHVPTNLQVIPAKENLRKGSAFVA